ncbi:MAG: phosphate ABC transporter ATP-binding protein [Oscillospiraceae bacterium]|nr:phosphate ABC transporter ATP-binding protein [Oscillospiraceae bacterium]
MAGQHKISVRDMNVWFSDKQVIHSLNIDIPSNEIISVLGPANSGITTLLRSLNRLSDLNPAMRVEGEILLDGNNIRDVSVTELRRKVGMVFDVPTPLPISIFDNIAYGPRLSGTKNMKNLTGIVEQSLREAALWDDVKDRLYTPAMSLSGGQQQRLCIARVLALKPEVILLDRPCSGLDPLSTAKIEESLKNLKAQFTIIIAPHNVQQASRVSDHIAFMLMGHLVEHGTAEKILTNPKDQRTNDYLTGRFG